MGNGPYLAMNESPNFGQPSPWPRGRSRMMKKHEKQQYVETVTAALRNAIRFLESIDEGIFEVKEDDRQRVLNHLYSALDQ